MHIKKAWHSFAFIGFLEVFDYLILLTTTNIAHACWREHRCFIPGGFWKCRSSKESWTSYFAFSYSMVCITELCGSAHRRFVSLLLISFCHFSTRKDTTFFICPSPGQSSKFKIQSSKFKIQGSRFKVLVSRFWFQGSKSNESWDSAAASFCSVLETSKGRSRSGLSSLMPATCCPNSEASS